MSGEPANKTPEQETYYPRPMNIEKFTVDLFDRDNPLSVVNLLSPKAAQRVEEVPREYFESDERALRKVVQPNATVNMLRYNFWVQYEDATLRGTKITLQNVPRGICSKQSFDKIWKKDKFLAWILTPPSQYSIALNEALDYGMSRLREILELPLKKSNGSVDTATASLLFRVVSFLDARAHGSIVQRSVNVHQIHGNKEKYIEMGEVREVMKDISVAEIDQRIKYLEKKAKMHGLIEEGECGDSDNPMEEGSILNEKGADDTDTTKRPPTKAPESF